MIIKTNKAIIDTCTYDSFYIDYRNYSLEYRLLAVNKNTFDNILLYSDENKENVEKLLETIYDKFNRVDSCTDLKV